MTLAKKKSAKEAVAHKKHAEAQRENPTPKAPVWVDPLQTTLPPGEIKLVEPIPTPQPSLPMAKTVMPPGKWVKGATLLFLDGGLGKAENWQNQVMDAVKRLGIQVLNPRRWEDTRLKLKQEITEQIKWEQEAIEEAEYFAFWFTGNWCYPIAFYRLGQAMARKKKIYVGAHPDSPILADLEAQLEHYGAKVYQNLGILCQDLLADLTRVVKKD